MSKDPAVLLYTGDFLTGTFTMTNEQVGKYIRLLCLQHQKGILTEKDMLNICKSYDDDVYLKFIKTDDGYYNERMKIEAEKRKRYSESRAENRKQKGEKPLKSIKRDVKKTSKTYVKHMENENRNEIDNVIYKSAIEIYFEFYEKQVGIKPAFSGAEGKHLKELLIKLENSIKSKGGEISQDGIGNAFVTFLNKLPKFYLEKLDIKILNSKYDGIIAEIRSKSGSTMQDSMQNILADRERRRQEATANSENH